MSIDEALDKLHAAEYNQCGCLGDSLADAIADLEEALAMRPSESGP
jgi:hypothetical protein